MTGVDWLATVALVASSLSLLVTILHDRARRRGGWR